MTGNDLLPSWSEGMAKGAILEFTESVTEPGTSYVPPADRIATFDNDGTLWCEKPQYAQADFLFRRWQQMVQADPAKAMEQPYKAVAENDQAWLTNLLDHVPELVKGAGEAYEGITVGAFEQAVLEFFATATHPVLGLPYTKAGYRPMRELLDLLAAREFLVLICSGGGRDFVWPVSEQMYGIPRERVIGGFVPRRRAVPHRGRRADGRRRHRQAGAHLDADRAHAAPGRRQRRRRRSHAPDRPLRPADPPRRRQPRVRLRHRRGEGTGRGKERGWTVVSMRNDLTVVFGP